MEAKCRVSNTQKECSAIFGRSAANQSLISGVEDRGEGDDFLSVHDVFELS
jgi:hypothetical protein